MEAPAGNLANRMLGRGSAIVWAMAAGGALWIIHGYLRILMPSGPDVV